jgi:transposase-like protein
MARRRVGRYTKEFRRVAVERLKACDNIVELSQELGVHRRLLYKWRYQFDPFDLGEESPPENSRESALRNEVNQLKRVLVDKTLELDFFKGALQESRLDAKRAVSVARRRLRRNPRSDAFKRQLKHRANMSAAGVSRAGFYRSLQGRAPVEEDMETRSVIRQIAVEHRRRYGYRRISAELRRRGMLVHHKRVLRIIREDNLSSAAG